MALVNMAPVPSVSDAKRAREPSCEVSAVDSVLVVQTENPVVMQVPSMVVTFRMTLVSAELPALTQLLTSLLRQSATVPASLIFTADNSSEFAICTRPTSCWRSAGETGNVGLVAGLPTCLKG